MAANASVVGVRLTSATDAFWMAGVVVFVAGGSKYFKLYTKPSQQQDDIAQRREGLAHLISDSCESRLACRRKVALGNRASGAVDPALAACVMETMCEALIAVSSLKAALVLPI